VGKRIRERGYKNMKDLLDLAQKICKEAHAGQVDKACKPYYLHPFHVAEMCSLEKEKIAAYLHDVIEDNESYSIEYLRKQGFPEDILAAVDKLTHKKGVSYDEYIKEIKDNDLARVVKINDLTHNSDLNRLSLVTEKDLARVKKYEYYLKYLKEA